MLAYCLYMNTYTAAQNLFVSRNSQLLVVDDDDVLSVDCWIQFHQEFEVFNKTCERIPFWRLSATKYFSTVFRGSSFSNFSKRNASKISKLNSLIFEHLMTSFFLFVFFRKSMFFLSGNTSSFDLFWENWIRKGESRSSYLILFFKQSLLLIHQFG